MSTHSYSCHGANNFARHYPDHGMLRAAPPSPKPRTKVDPLTVTTTEGVKLVTVPDAVPEGFTPASFAPTKMFGWLVLIVHLVCFIGLAILGRAPDPTAPHSSG